MPTGALQVAPPPTEAARKKIDTASSPVSEAPRRGPCPHSGGRHAPRRRLVDMLSIPLGARHAHAPARAPRPDRKGVRPLGHLAARRRVHRTHRGAADESEPGAPAAAADQPGTPHYPPPPPCGGGGSVEPAQAQVLPAGRSAAAFAVQRGGGLSGRPGSRPCPSPSAPPARPRGPAPWQPRSPPAASRRRGRRSRSAACAGDVTSAVTAVARDRHHRDPLGQRHRRVHRYRRRRLGRTPGQPVPRRRRLPVRRRGASSLRARPHHGRARVRLLRQRLLLLARHGVCLAGDPHRPRRQRGSPGRQASAKARLVLDGGPWGVPRDHDHADPDAGDVPRDVLRAARVSERAMGREGHFREQRPSPTVVARPRASCPA